MNSNNCGICMESLTDGRPITVLCSGIDNNNIETFYFSSFDESWKVGPEGEVGAHWGIWDKHEELKW